MQSIVKTEIDLKRTVIVEISGGVIKQKVNEAFSTTPKIVLNRFRLLVTAQNENKFNVIIYNLMYELFLKKEFTSPWIKLVKDTLENLGYNYIWQGQYVDNVELFKIKIKQRLTDQYKKQWEASLYESSKCSFYKTINNDLRMQQYLLTLPFSQRKS